VQPSVSRESSRAHDGAGNRARGATRRAEGPHAPLVLGGVRPLALFVCAVTRSALAPSYTHRPICTTSRAGTDSAAPPHIPTNSFVWENEEMVSDDSRLNRRQTRRPKALQATVGCPQRVTFSGWCRAFRCAWRRWERPRWLGRAPGSASAPGNRQWVRGFQGAWRR
jgi:hypothetical protein